MKTKLKNKKQKKKEQKYWKDNNFIILKLKDKFL